MSRETNSRFLILFCYMTWFDGTRHWRPCKRGLHVRSIMSMQFTSCVQEISLYSKVVQNRVMKIKWSQRPQDEDQKGHEKVTPANFYCCTTTNGSICNVIKAERSSDLVCTATLLSLSGF